LAVIFIVEAAHLRRHGKGSSNYKVKPLARSWLTIGALAKATATKPETIRYYERIGLLPAPARSGANYRSYTDDDRKRLAFIRKSRALGFTIEQVRALLRLADRHAQSCAEVDRMAREHVHTIEAKIAALVALGDELRGLIAQCRRGTISECRILEALSPK
jgi:DNA-binding transcriptional MerR regulator